MSMKNAFPEAQVVLDEGLSFQQRGEVLDKISELDGVLTASFNDASCKEMTVLYGHRQPLPKKEILGIPGVRDIY